LIEDRLKEVENRVVVLENNRCPPILNEPPVPVPLANSDTTQPEQLETASSGDETLDNVDALQDSIDGMGAVTFAPEEDCASFGISLRNVFRYKG
jgi:hypothetical protein